MSLADKTISHLNSFGIIEVSGKDAGKLLQGQITINIDTISNDKLSLAAMCNPKGRCVALFFIMKKPEATDSESYWLILKHDLIEHTMVNLKKYAIFFATEINDISRQYSLLGTVDDSNNKLASKGKMVSVGLEVNNLHILICDDSDDISKQDPELGDESTWLYQLTYNGLPWLEQNSSGLFLPHNLNLPALNAVDFKKGCFTGQEVIARMQYKGKLKSHMQHFGCDSSCNFNPGDKVFCDARVGGEVICGASSQTGETSLLILLKDKYLECEFFRLNSENGPILTLLNA